MDIVSGSEAPQATGPLRKSGRAKTAPRKLLTKGEITAQALRILRFGRYNCWQQHNVRTVPGRTFKGRKGVTDIIGFNQFTALFMVCDAKTVTDRLRPEQIVLMTEVTNAGGLALIAHQDMNGKVVLTEFKDWPLKK